MSLDLEKNKFRATAQSARRAAVEAAPANAADLLADNVMSVMSAVPVTADGGAVVSTYLALANEMDLEPTMVRLLNSGARVVLPVVLGRDQPLIFRQWRPGIPLQDGSLKTRHPGPENPELDPNLLLVPLLAYDDEGHRMGWGGGFYDRTLARLRAADGSVVAAGVAYAGQWTKRVPRGPNDEVLDWIITERGATRIGGTE